MNALTDNDLIRTFLSAYEHGSWADANCIKPDDVVRNKQAVDQLATRKSDGTTLAIEHTIIEPFVGDKADFALFRVAFLEIEADKSLLIPGLWIRVFVPVDILKHRPQKESRDAIISSVHDWIKVNRVGLREGAFEYRCRIVGTPNEPPYDITLNVRVVPLQSGPDAKSGILHIRRQQVSGDLSDVVSKALRMKIPKLVGTPAKKHILLLERQHMNLDQQSVLDEIENQRASHPDLVHVDQIWFVDTTFYGTEFGGTCLRFDRFENRAEISSFDFSDGHLMTKFEDGVAEVVRR
jgi:hypothetical protein